MGILNYDLVNEISTDSFQITKQSNTVYLQFANADLLDDSQGYIDFF